MLCILFLMLTHGTFPLVQNFVPYISWIIFLDFLLLRLIILLYLCPLALVHLESSADEDQREDWDRLCHESWCFRRDMCYDQDFAFTCTIQAGWLHLVWLWGSPLGCSVSPIPSHLWILTHKPQRDRPNYCCILHGNLQATPSHVSSCCHVYARRELRLLRFGQSEEGR